MADGVGVLGDAEPKFQMSTYNEFTFFGKLSLRFLIHWKQGGDNINLTSLENDFGGTSADYDNVTNKLGVPDAVYRIMQIGTDAHIFVQDASYLRWRSAATTCSRPACPRARRVGRALEETLRRKLDGLVSGRDEELETALAAGAGSDAQSSCPAPAWPSPPAGAA